MTNYQYASDEPIANVDRDGLEELTAVDWVSGAMSDEASFAGSEVVDELTLAPSHALPLNILPEVSVSFKPIIQISNALITPSDNVNTWDALYKVYSGFGSLIKPISVFLQNYQPPFTFPKGDQSNTSEVGNPILGSGTKQAEGIPQAAPSSDIIDLKDYLWSITNIFKESEIDELKPILSPLVRHVSNGSDVAQDRDDISKNSNEIKKKYQNNEQNNEQNNSSDSGTKKESSTSPQKPVGKWIKIGNMNIWVDGKQD